MSKHTILDPGGNNIQRDMWHIDYPSPSDLELKIRKEVMDAVGGLEAEMFKMQTIENVKYMEIIKDRLNLLWGSND